MVEVTPVKTFGLIVLAILMIFGGWNTEGYWQAIFIEFGFGVALFLALELFLVGGVFWQIPAFGPLIWAWFADDPYWQSLLITIGSTYLLYYITLWVNSYVPEILEDLAPRDPYRPEVEEINHPGQVRQVTLTGWALHEFDEFQRAKRREYKEWLHADIMERSRENWIAILADIEERREQQLVRKVRSHRKRRGPKRYR